MTKYEVTAVSARLAAGVLVLTKEQSGPRKHNLKALGGNKFEIVNPVEFKAGEVFGFDGEVPKALAAAVADVEKAPAKKAKAKKDEPAIADIGDGATGD